MHLDPIFNPIFPLEYVHSVFRESGSLHSCTLPRTGQYSRQASVGGREPRYRCTSGSTTFGHRGAFVTSVFNRLYRARTPRCPVSVPCHPSGCASLTCGVNACGNLMCLSYVGVISYTSTLEWLHLTAVRYNARQPAEYENSDKCWLASRSLAQHPTIVGTHRSPQRAHLHPQHMRSSRRSS